MTGAMFRQSLGMPRSKRALRPEAFSTRKDYEGRSSMSRKPGIGGSMRNSTGRFPILDVVSMILTFATAPDGTWNSFSLFHGAQEGRLAGLWFLNLPGGFPGTSAKRSKGLDRQLL